MSALKELRGQHCSRLYTKGDEMYQLGTSIAQHNVNVHVVNKTDKLLTKQTGSPSHNIPLQEAFNFQASNNLNCCNLSPN